ncbi:hypothetical protein Syun_022782 [Stephania yunnanensis]|uniref:tRNA-binding domain-containing protein n=1 Tax=Stephania yunnanensis TaxID=152371 RepID=A0AAP0I300_9MAGN
MGANGGANDSLLNRNKALVCALCKHLSLTPQSFSSECVGTNDIKAVFSYVLKLSGREGLLNSNEVIKWVKFVDAFPIEPEGCKGAFKGLNEDLALKSVLLGGLKISETDVLVFSTVHSLVNGLSITERQQYPNVLRWMDYIQSSEDLGDVYDRIPVQKVGFEPHVSKNSAEFQSDQSSEKSASSLKTEEKLEADSKSKKSSIKGMIAERYFSLLFSIKQVNPIEQEYDILNCKFAISSHDRKSTEEKKIVSETKGTETNDDLSISLFNIQIGVIRKVWKHPSADSLLVEEIDLGDGNVRQVVSGLAKYCTLEALANRQVVLITNVKPGKLRDVVSAGLVLCASNQDHTVIEPLIPPEGAKIGERVSFLGHDGKPEDILNPKKKQLEKITPHLYTDEKGIATFKGIPFMTSAGACKSSIANASIK